LKEEALDRTTQRNHFGRGVGPVVRQITDCIIIIIISVKSQRAGNFRQKILPNNMFFGRLLRYFLDWFS
jgi:hypothetical protein